MKKLIPIFLMTAAMAMPWACSNNSPTSPTATDTPTLTATPTIWANYTKSPTPTFSFTPTSTPTNLNGYTSTPSFTSTPTSTPTDTPTNLNGYTSTPSFTSTTTATRTNTGTSTPTSTATFTFTPFPVASPAFKKMGPSVQYPNGLAVGNGNLYVVEGDGGASGNDLLVFNASSFSLSRTVNAFGPTAFINPNGVAVDPTTHNIYVVDSGNSSSPGAVYEFDTSGATTIASWSSWTGGSVTSFFNPEGIAVDGSGNIFVADTGNNTVEQFTTSGPTVNYVNQWNTGTTAFSSPSAVAAINQAGPTTLLFVADADNELVQKFDGTTWSSWPTTANSDLFGITADNSGNVYTADSGNGLVTEYNAGGVFQTQWNGSSAPSAFVSPDGVILSGGDVWVTDFENGSSDQGTLTVFGP